MIYLSIFITSMILTYIIRYYALKKAILDIPNERSSHAVATPRGGGLAIVLSFFIGLFYLYDSLMIDQKLFFALLCALPIVMVSFVDDLITLSSKIRLLVQLLSGAGALYFLGGVERVDFILFEISGWWLNLFALLSIIWLTNLYNFLDGIDGYAGSEAIFVGVASFALLHNQIGLVIAVASLGFLIFNWHKASIFMGDVGSATLGFIFAILVFSDTCGGNIYLWFALLSLFWFDATLTLIRRYKNGENIATPHKKHAYQRLTQYGYSHAKVVIYAMIINIFIFLSYFVSAKEFYPYLFIFQMVGLYALMKFTDNKKEFR